MISPSARFESYTAGGYDDPRLPDMEPVPAIYGVLEHLDATEKNIELLNDAFAQLIKKLGPILIPYGPEESESPSETAPDHWSGMSVRVDRFNRSLSAQHAMIHRLIDRIDI